MRMPKVTRSSAMCRAEPPLAPTSVANIENGLIKLNVDITATSGWLQRLVRRKARSIVYAESLFRSPGAEEWRQE